MSRDTAWLKTTLGAWVASTSGSKVAVPNAPAVRRRLDEVRAWLSQRGGGPGPLEPRDEALAAFSLLSLNLVRESRPSETVCLEAGAAFELLADLKWSDDEMGETSELLCRFAFLSWRHARSQRLPRLSQEWLERFDANFVAGSAHHDCLDYFLACPASDRSSALNAAFLADAEDLFAVCSILRKRRNEVPGELIGQILSLQRWVEREFQPASFADEREYFLAQFETSLSTCTRWVGQREASFEHCAKAEQLYLDTVEPETGLVELDLMRLTTRYDMGEYSTVLAPLRLLQGKLRTLGMSTALVKSELLEGAVLKCLGLVNESTVPCERALTRSVLKDNPGLRVFVLEQLADTLALQGKFESAQAYLTEAASLMTGREGVARAFLKLVVGEGCRLRGALETALQKYREAANDYAELGIEASVAYARLNAAEVLLIMGRDREAEVEVLSALPTIEKCKMVREALSAYVLLRESLRRRKTDRNALRELREHLQGKR